MFQHTMKRLIPLAAVCCLTASALSAYAQTSTEGAIGGTVFDATGAVVPNAHITITNAGTNASINLTSDSSGFFKAPLLEPGSYQVKVTAQGFSSYSDSVIVQVSQFTTLQPRLVAGGTADQVDVTADVPLLNTDAPDFSSTINLNALDNIPVNNRRWSALALLTPGVTVDTSGYGLISVRGISTILNNIEIDGADDNQAYFAEERGRTREAYSTSGSAVREFAVNTGVYAAEYGRAAGGVVNSVTKSGTNQIHGEAYFYDRESKWNAYQDQTTIPVVAANGTATNVPYKPEDVRKIYGISIGGPIIKDKLFWFYTYDQHSRIFPFAGVANVPTAGLASTSSPGFNQTADPAPPSGTTCQNNGYVGAANGTSYTLSNILDGEVCTLAARLGQPGNYGAGLAAYTSDLAALNADLGLINRVGYQEINTPKLDWQINEKEHVSLLYHRLRWDSPGGVQTSASGGYSFSSTGNDFVKLDYGVAKLTSLLRSNLSNELLYQYGRELNDETQQPFTSYDTGTLKNQAGDVPYVTLDTSIGAYFGSPYYSYRPKYPDERKWQIGDVLYLQKGNNSFKFGVDTVHNYDLTNQQQYYEGNFIYTTNLANYFADLGNDFRGRNLSTGSCDIAQTSYATSATATTVDSYPCYNSYEQGYGNPIFQFSTLDFGAFAQDNWKIRPRLTLELGLRYDIETIPAAPSAITSAVSATTTTAAYTPFNGVTNQPSNPLNFGPRIGFAFDVYGDGKTVLRGGYGLYYGRITNGNIGTVLSTTGSPLSQTTVTISQSTFAANGTQTQRQAALAGLPIFPNQFTAAQTALAIKPSADFLGPNLKNPEVSEVDLQVQQQLGHGTAFQVAYLSGFGRRLPNFLDVNLDPTSEVTANLTVSDNTGLGRIPNGTVLQVPTFTKYGNVGLLGPNATNFQAINEFVSNVNSNYQALSAEIKNSSLRSLQFDVNYTWAHSLDYNQNATTAGGSNGFYDPYQNYRVNYGNSQWDIPNRLIAYAIYNFPKAADHGALKYLGNDWSIDTSFQAQTGLPFSAGLSGSTSKIPTGVGTATTSGVGSGLNGNGGVSFLPQIGHNNFFYNRDLVDDLRVEKQIPFGERAHLQIFLQAFNVANHQNETSANTTAYKVSGTTLTYQANFGTVSKTNNTNFSYTPRALELSGRLFF